MIDRLWVQRAAKNPLLLLYGFLVVHWVLFIDYGEVDFYSFDWYAIHQWLDVAKLALRNDVIPYEVRLWSAAGPFPDLFGTRYFAMPFLIASPQIVLLRWVSVQSFITIQVLLAMSANFYALILWKRHLRLSRFSAAILILMWSLNGALVGRMGVGHIQLAGYFLIPVFVYAMKLFADSTRDAIVGDASIRIALLLACVLFAVLLQGSVHTVYQMSLIVALFGIVFTRSARYATLSLAVFALLASYFVLPNVIFGAYSVTTQSIEVRQMFAGYGTGFSPTLRSITGIALPDVSLAALTARNAVLFLAVHFVEVTSHLLLALVYPFSAWFDGSWEYSIYVGPVGVLLMCLGLYEFGRQRDSSGRTLPGAYRRETFLVTLVLLLSLSISSAVIWMVAQKYLSINAIDRLPTRLLLYPFFVSLLCMCVGLDRMKRRVFLLDRWWVKWAIVATLAVSLVVNSSHWSFHSVSMVSRVVEYSARQQKPVFATGISEVVDPRYRFTVNAGFAMTLLSLAGVVGSFAFLQKRTLRRSS